MYTGPTHPSSPATLQLTWHVWFAQILCCLTGQLVETWATVRYIHTKISNTFQHPLTWNDKILYGNLTCFRTENEGMAEVLDTWRSSRDSAVTYTSMSQCAHMCLHIGHMISSNTSQYLQWDNVSKTLVYSSILSTYWINWGTCGGLNYTELPWQQWEVVYRSLANKQGMH